MPIFKKAPAQAAVPTLEQELNGAHAQAAAALSFFEAAAADLHEAALKQDEIAGRIYDEIERLEQTALATVQASLDNAGAALRIRELLGHDTYEL